MEWEAKVIKINMAKTVSITKFCRSAQELWSTERHIIFIAYSLLEK